MSAFDDLDARLRPNRQGVLKKFSERIAALERLRPWLVGLGVFGALVAAASKAFSGAAGTALAIGGAVIAAIGGAFVAAIDYRKLELGTNLTEAEAIAEAAIERGRALEGERDHLAADARALDLRRLALIDAGSAMLEACEGALLTPDLSLEQAIDTVLRAGQRSVLGAIDFEQGEYWAVSVFLAEGEELRRIVALRPDPLDEQVDGRTWRRGEGFAGMAWQHGDEVIIPDCAQPDIAAAYKVPPAKQAGSDAQRYRSMAVIPVQVGPDSRFWGAVAVSSDRAGRFSRVSGNDRSKNVETVRLIARTVELLAAGFARGNQ